MTPKLRYHFAGFLFTLLMVWMPFSGFNQTTTIVYSENFNSGNGGWTIGGYNASWNYGVPTLPNIASNGTPCFATGDAGVAQVEPYTSCLPVPGPSPGGNYYNCCERSFIESPSINLTGINSPMLSLDFNLYCEQTYDGVKAQLSIDGGASWQDIGIYNSGTYQVFPSSLNCREQNWYNKNNINYLTGTSGGCGTVSYAFGGNNSGWSGGCSQAASGGCLLTDVHGTNGWLTATHCIQAAANKSNVKIRIAFGAGSQVFSDGIAIDNVKILNIFPVVNFTVSQPQACGPEISFTNTTDCGNTWSWDFGHPGSPGNTSTLQNPVHQFPSSGSYSITLTATDYCGGIVSLVKTIQVNDGNVAIIDSIGTTNSGLCNSAIDSMLIYLSPANTGTPPYELNYQINGVNETVPGLTGNPIIIDGLESGIYTTVSLTDANGCEVNYPSSAEIPFNDDGLQLEVSNDTTINIGSEATLNAHASLPSSFVWTPTSGLSDPGSSVTIASPDITTTYQVIATDVNGCSVTEDVTVFVKDPQKCNNYFVPNSFTPNGDGKNDRYNIFADPSMRLENFELKIFNRWGETVYEANQIEAGWDGSKMMEGVYVVKIEFSCKNKTKSSYTGTIKLIR